MNCKNSFFEKLGSVIYMASQIASMGFAFLINVLMTNYSGGDDVYGQYKYATNFILTIPALFSLGITWSCAALIAKNDEKNKKGVVTASIVYTTLIGVIITVALYIISGISTALDVETFQNVMIVFPFVAFFLLQKLVNQIYMGMGETFRLSLYSAAPNLFIFLGLLVSALCFHKIEYTFAILLYLLSYVIVILPKMIGIKYDISNFKASSRTLLQDLKTNGFKVHLSSIFTTSSTQIIALVCGNIYGYAEYGYYSLAASLATVFQFIGSSVAVVKFKQYTNTERIAKKDFIFMVGLGGVAYALMFFAIDTVFFWFYPESYKPTILYLKLLCLSNLIYGFSTLFNRFFIGKGLGGRVMKNSFITAAATIVIDVPMILLFEMRGMAVATIAVSVICLCAYIFDYRKYRQEAVKGKIIDENILQ